MTRQLDYAAMKAVFTRFREAEAEPKGELDYVNAFTLLVAVALSAQATDKSVNKATPALFAAADTPEKMVALGIDKIRDHIDHLEMEVDDEIWPLPKYRELLFTK